MTDGERSMLIAWLASMPPRFGGAILGAREFRYETDSVALREWSNSQPEA